MEAQFAKIRANRPVFYSLIFVAAIVVLIILFKKYKEFVRAEKMEPVFIRNIKKADKMIQISDNLIPAPEGGVGFTYSTWLFVSDWTKGMDKFKHVFSKGDLDNSSSAPAVWLLPNINSMAIIMDTSDRTKASENIVEKKNMVPKEYYNLGPKDQKLANQSACTCKGFLTVDELANQAVFLNDSKDCIIYGQPRELEESDVATTWEKKNLNNDTVNPEENPQILNNPANTIIVENIPLQRWFHLAIVTMETSMEVYIDGKLYKTIVLKSLPKINVQPLFVNKDGGFDGMINELRYYARPLTAMEVYNMYTRGPTPFYLMYMFKGKLELYEQKAKDITSRTGDFVGDIADRMYD
jgi:hypothetical protein